MKFTSFAYTVSLLIVGLGLAVNSSHGAAEFNGTNSYGIIVDQSFLNGATVTDFTIEVWVKNERPAIDQMFGGKTEFWKEWGIYFYAGGGIGFGTAWPYSYYGLTTTNCHFAGENQPRSCGSKPATPRCLSSYQV